LVVKIVPWGPSANKINPLISKLIDNSKVQRYLKNLDINNSVKNKINTIFSIDKIGCQ
jgi:hypothetical protein